MERPEYLSQYMFDWELFDVVLGGRSALDTKYFIASLSSSEEVDDFLVSYGIDPSQPVSQAELFGNFQEALQFTRRYFLKEGNAEGLDLKIPHRFLMITDVRDIFMMSTGNVPDCSKEERLWAEVILKIMHTILHVDKDLRSSYFSTIQTQIFDRFYRYLNRDENNRLFIQDQDQSIEIEEFETKSKKMRDSVIIKLLHKPENVAEELFDRIGVRIVTKNIFDIFRVIKFLLRKNIVIPHNIKPSRSLNSIFDFNEFRKKYLGLIKDSIRNKYDLEQFYQSANELLKKTPIEGEFERNPHTAKKYRSIQFTCRQLIRYKNPFLTEFKGLREIAREREDEELAKKILSLDMSLISRDTRFFYPFEVQICDLESHQINTEGDASHQEYKKNQIRSVIKRLFWAILKNKNIEY